MASPVRFCKCGKPVVYSRITVNGVTYCGDCIGVHVEELRAKVAELEAQVLKNTPTLGTRNDEVIFQPEHCW